MESQLGAIVLVGFMGAGKSTGARSLAAELGGQALDSDREIEARLGEPIESYFDRQGEDAFREQEESVVCELLAREDAPVIALGGGAVQSERGPRGAHPPHGRAPRDRPGRRLAPRLGQGPAAGPRPGPLRVALARPPGVYESVSDVVVPPADRDALRRALPFVLALREAPSGTRLVWAAAESGDYPVFLGRGLIESGFFPPLGGRRFVVTDENVARVQRVEGDERIVVMPGEDHKTIHGAEHVLRSLSPRAAPSAATWSWPSGAGWSATWPASARPCTSAACATRRCRPRWWPRWTPPMAGRPGSTCPRARTTWAPTTSRRRCSATRPRSTRCRWRRWRPATSRWSRRR